MFRPTQQWILLKLVTHSPILYPAIRRMELHRGTDYIPPLKASFDSLFRCLMFILPVSDQAHLG